MLSTVVEVVNERLSEAEKHYALLQHEQQAQATAQRLKLAEFATSKARQRILASCWLAIRLWVAHQRLLGERQSWRDLLQSLQAEVQFLDPSISLPKSMQRPVRGEQGASMSSSASISPTSSPEASDESEAAGLGDESERLS